MSRPGRSQSPRRQGPRPLPLHLLTAGATWQSSRLALPLLKNGLLPWKPDLASRAAALKHDLAGIELPELAAAIEAELRLRADHFAQGIEAYRHHPYRRSQAPAPVTVWQDGTTRLLDYGPPDGRPVLVIPSLINRAYILDLMEGSSMLRHMAACGLRPLLIDWDRPGDDERSFDLTAYVAGRLEQVLDAACVIAGPPISVIGYCMGGLLALALAQRQSHRISKLVLLATPWNFHSAETDYAVRLGALADPIKLAFSPLGEVPTDMLQAIFAIADPLLAIRKFSRFADLAPDSPEAIRFVAIEDWLNDGIPLALPTAHECLAGWYGANTPFSGTWRIAGRKVLPEEVTQPALVVIPSRDRLVPPTSAQPLVTLLPNAQPLQRDLGHIGIIIGNKAKAEVWTPVIDWLLS